MSQLQCHPKSCARFGLNFSIFLLCQVKIPDEMNTNHVYLLGKKYKQTSSSLLLATVGLKFSSKCSRQENLSTTFAGEFQSHIQVIYSLFSKNLITFLITVEDTIFDCIILVNNYKTSQELHKSIRILPLASTFLVRLLFCSTTRQSQYNKRDFQEILFHLSSSI